MDIHLFAGSKYTVSNFTIFSDFSLKNSNSMTLISADTQK